MDWWASLADWGADDHRAALGAYLGSVPAGWPRPPGDDARAFFQTAFRAAAPVEGLLTGYYEPELEGSLAPAGRFRHPLHAPPAGWSGGLWHSRSEIRSGNLLEGRELAWADSALDAFLAQVQGSVRVRLAEGGILRLGHAGGNGHPYRSIGRELVERGAIAADRVSVPAIRDWCLAHPADVAALLALNPSYAFFRILPPSPGEGPIGTAGCALSPLRSVAVDPARIPLGAPVWIETRGPLTRRALAVAQDTGSAIVGEGRIDLYCGSGAAAGAVAGTLRQPCRVTCLYPAPVPR